MSASGNAFKDLCGVPPPKGLENLNSKTKGEFFGAITGDQWEEIFNETITTEPPDEMPDHVLKGKLGQIGNATLKASLNASLNSTSGIIDGFYATADDPNWHFGQTIMYGDGLGGITVFAGDRVTVSIVHTPSGQTMFTKTVTVKGA